MGFFKDFKEDFSEAVNELMPGSNPVPEEEDFTPAQDEDVDVNSEIGKLDGLLEKAAKRLQEESESAEEPKEEPAPEPAAQIEPEVTEKAPEPEPEPEPESEVVEPPKPIEPKIPVSQSLFGRFTQEAKKEEKMDENINIAPKEEPQQPRVASDENAVITSGMTIKGDLASTGSIEVQGKIDGNVDCNGKLTITGTVIGNSRAAEFFADSAHVTGEVVTTGTAKIGLGSIIIGNITATSAVIAGAVKGDIDVQGPVVVDTSAVIMGNIKSRSVQINNGAVIEGFCSQAYADVDVDKLFG